MEGEGQGREIKAGRPVPMARLLIDLEPPEDGDEGMEEVDLKEALAEVLSAAIGMVVLVDGAVGIEGVDEAEPGTEAVETASAAVHLRVVKGSDE